MSFNFNKVAGNSLVAVLLTMPKEWRPFIRFQSDLQSELRELAMTAPTNTAAFLEFFLTNRYRFHEALLVSALPEHSRAPMVDLIDRLNEARERKERLVKERDYIQAASALQIQKSLASELTDKLKGQDLFITTDTYTDAIDRMGWPDSGV